MKVVIQRVNSAKVAVENQTVGEIGAGLFVLLGVGKGDSKNDAEKLAEKISKLRIMADKNGKMNLSIVEAGGGILVVSQFTLHADTSAGNRPSFVRAAEPTLALGLYEHFIDVLRKKELDVATGRFGAYMNIEAALDGPVTIFLYSSD